MGGDQKAAHQDTVHGGYAVYRAARHAVRQRHDDKDGRQRGDEAGGEGAGEEMSRHAQEDGMGNGREQQHDDGIDQQLQQRQAQSHPLPVVEGRAPAVRRLPVCQLLHPCAEGRIEAAADARPRRHRRHDQCHQQRRQLVVGEASEEPADALAAEQGADGQLGESGRQHPREQDQCQLGGEQHEDEPA